MKITETMIAAALKIRAELDLAVDDPYWMDQWLRERLPFLFEAMTKESQNLAQRLTQISAHLESRGEEDQAILLFKDGKWRASASSWNSAVAIEEMHGNYEFVADELEIALEQLEAAVAAEKPNNTGE